MDSSGSMGSSSGGWEEYDSRVDSVSAFFGMSNPLSHIGSMSNSNHPPPPRPLSPSLQPLPPPDHHRLHQTSHMFDPLSSYLDPLSTRQHQPQQPYSNMNFDMVWSKNPRSEANCGGFGDGFTASTQQSLTARPSTEEHQDHHHHNMSSEKFLRTPGLVQRNPKKRSRASRRAPTTVLTTDTTNFRAMVQEFTGIPAPPFSSPFPRTKLDFFGGSGSNSNSSNGGMTSSPLLTSNYLLRPFAHKLQSPLIPPFLTNTTPSSFSNSNILCSSSPATTNYQQQQLNPQNLQIPSRNFQTFPSPKQQQTPLENNLLNDPQLKMGAFEGFGLGHGLQSLVSSSTPKSDLLQSVNDDSQQATHTKVNCSGLSSSSLEFHGDKRQFEINVTRSEGIVESWINCSSDPS